MDWIFEIIGVLMLGGLGFLALIGWGAWFTDGKFEESKQKSKTYITIIVVGIIMYLGIFN